MPQLIEKFPHLYNSLLPEFFHTPYPEEKWATCANCTLCRAPKSPYLDTKCCDYHPYLANYLVGGILQDDRPGMAEGKKRIRDLIKKKEGITPYGVLPPAAYERRRDEYKLKGKAKFNNREQVTGMRCPFYEQGNCTVWDYRENLCVTHFCVSTGGKMGHKFWNAVNRYVKMTENVLSTNALYELGFPPGKINTEAIHTIEFQILNERKEIDLGKYEKLWRGWSGREEELYIRCYEIVSALDQQQFESISGHNQVILKAAIEQSLEEFRKNMIPDYLKMNSEAMVTEAGSNEVLISLNQTSVKVSYLLFSFIKMMEEGRSTREIIDLGFQVLLNIGDDIGNLFQRGILIPVDNPNGTFPNREL